MYKIICDDHTIYDLRNEELILISPKLDLEDNTAGMLSFTILPEHPYYDIIYKLQSDIAVTKDDKVIFKGRVISETKSFNNALKIECEGKLAYFNDSVFRKFEFADSPSKLFRTIINNHNEQVSERQQFKVGQITVSDNNDYIVRSSENNINSWSALKDKCFNSSLGGHIRIRYEPDGDYVDWLADFDKVALQAIEFGENLLDINREVTANETYTAIMPLGAEVNGERVTITSVNNNKDYIVNKERATEYGVIFAPQDLSVWSDVTTPTALLTKATNLLNEIGIRLRETVEVRAIDLRLTDNEIESFNLCEYINIYSRPHNLSKRYLLSKMQIDMENPQNSVFTLGVVNTTLTDIQRSQKQIAQSAEMSVQEVQRKIPQNLSELKNDAEYVTVEDVIKYIDDSGSGSGENGKDGVSPIIEITENTSESYRLVIKDAEKTFETPNLKGADGLQGLKGDPGEPGAKGETGEQGLRGEPGTAATIQIGTVSTGAPGTDAQVSNTGSSTAAVFNFTIPRGEKGDSGDGGSGESGGDNSLFSFTIKEDGHLYVCGETQDVNNFYISVDGHLKYKVGGDEMYEIDLGNVVGQGSGSGIEIEEKVSFDGGWYRKLGEKLVEINLESMSSAKTWNSGSGATLTTLPEGYRPSSAVYVAAIDTAGVLLELGITTTGSVGIINRAGASKSVRYLRGHIIYSV